MFLSLVNIFLIIQVLREVNSFFLWSLLSKETPDVFEHKPWKSWLTTKLKRVPAVLILCRPRWNLSSEASEKADEEVRCRVKPVRGKWGHTEGISVDDSYSPSSELHPMQSCHSWMVIRSQCRQGSSPRANSKKCLSCWHRRDRRTWDLWKSDLCIILILSPVGFY